MGYRPMILYKPSPKVRKNPRILSNHKAPDSHGFLVGESLHDAMKLGAGIKGREIL